GAYASLDRLEYRATVDDAAGPRLRAHELAHVPPAAGIFGDGKGGTRDARVAFEPIDTEGSPILVTSAQEEPGWNVPGPRVPEKDAQAVRGHQAAPDRRDAEQLRKRSRDGHDAPARRETGHRSE